MSGFLANPFGQSHSTRRAIRLLEMRMTYLISLTNPGPSSRYFPPYWTLKKYVGAKGQLGDMQDYEAFLTELDKVWSGVIACHPRRSHLLRCWRCMYSAQAIRSSSCHAVALGHSSCSQARPRCADANFLAQSCKRNHGSRGQRCRLSTGSHTNPVQPSRTILNTFSLRKGGEYRQAEPLQKSAFDVDEGRNAIPATLNMDTMCGALRFS